MNQQVHGELQYLWFDRTCLTDQIFAKIAGETRAPTPRNDNNRGIYESFSLKTTSSHIFKDDFKALDISEDWPK